MSAELLAKLTDKEREALRLVHRRLTSKEIAPLLGIRMDAVDARIKSATRKLGIPDRGKAALLLADHEANATYPQQVYQSSEIAGNTEKPNLTEPATVSLREEQSPFLVEAAVAAATPVAVPSEENVRITLSSWQRLGYIAVVAIGTIIALGLLVSALTGLVELAVMRERLF